MTFAKSKNISCPRYGYDDVVVELHGNGTGEMRVERPLKYAVFIVAPQFGRRACKRPTPTKLNSIHATCIDMLATRSRSIQNVDGSDYYQNGPAMSSE